ncbi:MAG TPA: hypothetical protein VEQ10_19110, partial [Vicinamibacteria bacterium]|nr:hypothetical protein [Vicinamibacteria bacterium]
VALRDRDDLVLAQPEGLSTYLHEFAPIKGIRVAQGADRGWGDFGLSVDGVPGFNATEVKPGSREILSILGRPLLVTGRHGKGRAVAFTGFTPRYAERISDGTGRPVPYALDQELYRNPAMKAYFRLFAAMLAEATDARPAVDGAQILAAREKPLFEILKDLPPAEVATPATVVGERRGDDVRFSLELKNGARLARLVRVRAEWDAAAGSAPFVAYDDNYVDLLPGETRVIRASGWLPPGGGRAVAGTLFVEGTNLAARRIAIRLEDVATAAACR